MNKHQILISLGYRPMDKGRQIWGKPIGYSLIEISLMGNSIRQIFYGVHNGELSIFSKLILPDDMEKWQAQIQYFETHEYHPIVEKNYVHSKNFTFLSMEEMLEYE